MPENLSRKERRRRELEGERRRRRLLVGGIVGFAVIVVGALAFIRFRPVQGVEHHHDLDRGHDEEVVFEDTGLPPVGGTHNPRWLNCGIYDEPVEASLAVHSLEHGAVWLAYRPDLPEADVATLRDIVRGDSFVLMTPYPSLEADVVMTAWGEQLVTDGAGDGRIDEFIRRYRGQGPEQGATCTGGVGTPIG